jgi:hypothetical protein
MWRQPGTAALRLDLAVSGQRSGAQERMGDPAGEPEPLPRRAFTAGPYSARCPITIRTARSRSSLGYCFGMKIILPRKEVSTEPGAVHSESAAVGR